MGERKPQNVEGGREVKNMNGGMSEREMLFRGQWKKEKYSRRNRRYGTVRMIINNRKEKKKAIAQVRTIITPPPSLILADRTYRVFFFSFRKLL